MAVLSAVLSLGNGDVAAQNTPAAPPSAAAVSAQPAANAPASPGEVAMRRGIEAYNAGKLANAIGSLSTAIANGGLKSNDLARSLYYRGLAYRRHGKPAQAIPDLTNAIWLPGGLTEAERNDAAANRSAAYREAGIAEPVGASSVAAAASAAAAPRVAAAPESGGSAATPAARSAPVAATSGWQTSTGGSTDGATAALAAAPATGVGTAPEGGGIGGFFNSLFGGFSGS
ncbi:MAG: hypothetical protein ACK4MF_02890, partial [Hyphomicrobiaceae bacterium]